MDLLYYYKTVLVDRISELQVFFYYVPVPTAGFSWLFFETINNCPVVFLQYFKLKAEPHETEATKRPKFFKSPRREFSELLKEANEKMASKLSNATNGGLPLSVEIEELDSSSDSASPPRQAKPFSLGYRVCLCFS